MKRITLRPIAPLCILAMAFILGGCTQPDGYIGKWFGSWLVTDIYIDGEIDREYADNQANNDHHQVMVSFEGQIFDMAYLNGREIYGSWEYAGETLTLDASYQAGNGAGAPYFNPFPEAMHFAPGVEIIQVKVTRLESRTMQWQYAAPDGKLYTYNFQKYP